MSAGNGAASPREFDVVVLGATGFTGRLVAEHLQRTQADSNLRWAVAGRNPDKLAAVCEDLGVHVERIIVDTTDLDALRTLAARTRAIATTVGPYALYGENVVAACAERGTHYCDLTGEVPWMRRMIDTYDAMATANGARIVHTCGFDSIPSDLGVLYTQQQMLRAHGVTCPRVRFRMKAASGGFSGGTAASLLNMVEEAGRDATVRRLLTDPYALDPAGEGAGPDGADLAGVSWDTGFRSWIAPFVMAGINTRVVRRSNALAGYSWGRDFRYDEAMLTSGGPLGLLGAGAIAGGSGLMMGAAALPLTRPLLARMLPDPGEGPDEKAREAGFFDVRLLGEHPDDPALNIWVKVTGDRDPGYGSTSKMIAQSALCLALDELDTPAGVRTPATAMGEVLIDRLVDQAGLTFEVLGFGARSPV